MKEEKNIFKDQTLTPTKKKKKIQEKYEKMEVRNK